MSLLNLLQISTNTQGTTEVGSKGQVADAAKTIGNNTDVLGAGQDEENQKFDVLLKDFVQGRQKGNNTLTAQQSDIIKGIQDSIVPAEHIIDIVDGKNISAHNQGLPHSARLQNESGSSFMFGKKVDNKIYPKIDGELNSLTNINQSVDDKASAITPSGLTKVFKIGSHKAQGTFINKFSNNSSRDASLFVGKQDLEQITDTQNSKLGFLADLKYKGGAKSKKGMQVYAKQNQDVSSFFSSRKHNIGKAELNIMQSEQKLSANSKTLDNQSDVLSKIDILHVDNYGEKQNKSKVNHNIFESMGHLISKSQHNMAQTKTIALNMDNVDVSSGTQLIDKVANYIEQNNLAHNQNMHLTVQHRELGNFDISVRHHRTDGLNIVINATTKEGQAFFTEHQHDLVSKLNQAGIQLSDFKVMGKVASFDAGFNGNNANSQEGGNAHRGWSSFSQGNSDFQDGAQRRKSLWEEYRERYYA